MRYGCISAVAVLAVIVGGPWLAVATIANGVVGRTLPAGWDQAAVRSEYLVSCGGCHGERGHTDAALVPNLRGSVGRFLCSATGRAYLIRLPNVAFANMSADELATLMNYVVFDLGAGSAPTGTVPYTAAEVARLRESPYRTGSLEVRRAAILERLPAACRTAIPTRPVAP